MQCTTRIRVNYAQLCNPGCKILMKILPYCTLHFSKSLNLRTRHKTPTKSIKNYIHRCRQHCSFFWHHIITREGKALSSIEFILLGGYIVLVCVCLHDEERERGSHVSDLILLHSVPNCFNWSILQTLGHDDIWSSCVFIEVQLWPTGHFLSKMSADNKIVDDFCHRAKCTSRLSAALPHSLAKASYGPEMESGWFTNDSFVHSAWVALFSRNKQHRF